MIYSPKFLAERRDVAVRFLSAYEKGLRDVANGGSHEPSNVHILAKAFKYDPSYVLQSVNYFDTRMTVNAGDIQDEERLWIDRGSLKISKPVPAEQLVDNSLVDSVLQKLGPAPSAKA